MEARNIEKEAWLILVHITNLCEIIRSMFLFIIKSCSASNITR